MANDRLRLNIPPRSILPSFASRPPDIDCFYFYLEGRTPSAAVARALERDL
jgi:hypothetical protein